MSLNLINVSEIVVPDCFNFPYKTSNSLIDTLISTEGGIIPSQTIFLTGQPGNGKTSIAVDYGGSIVDALEMPPQFKDGSVRPSGKPVLLSLEMSALQLKRLSQRIPNTNNFIIVKEDNSCNYMDWLDELKELKPSLIILDSVQELAERLVIYDSDNNIKGLSFDQYQQQIVYYFNVFSKATYTPVILIGHVNKNGKFKGPSGIEHKLDTHIVVYKDKKTNNRKLKIEKNRFGSDDIEVGVSLEPKGITYNASDLELLTADDLSDVVIESGKDSEIKNKVNEIVDKLKISEANLLESKNIKPENITVSFIKRKRNKSEFLFGQENKLEIRLSLHLINNKDEFWTKNEVELQYMKKVCRTQDDVLVWNVIKEFAKITNYRRLNVETIQFIYNIAIKNSELFSSTNDTISD